MFVLQMEEKSLIFLHELNSKITYTLDSTDARNRFTWKEQFLLKYLKIYLNTDNNLFVGSSKNYVELILLKSVLELILLKSMIMQ